MKMVEKIRLDSFEEISASEDVTGGMEAKVRQMLELVNETSIQSVQIFSGDEPGNLVRTLTGETLGTVISA